MTETYVQCTHCHRDIEQRLINQHEDECTDDRTVPQLINHADGTEVRALLRELIDKRPFFADLAEERLSESGNETGNSDIGLAPHEHE